MVLSGKGDNPPTWFFILCELHIPIMSVLSVSVNARA
jgi:hypothetical protein